ncbi:DUF5348 domain-containing protein [[Clostridium] innocuum]|uniref:DUF5348 domain-containing protein n=1 Tax=Clostridium innocuum TaxID=1522 RepID=UPI000D6C9722|nr:DUF5348 domain-containing protein [[Clostridium] innocuum]MCR0317410.1 DUF5348 domain-containing protein [[Clostridium] innocuum]MCR0371683.1 DUF5348 domain-containing protein [[Clostridium] innocuum]MCR0375954.1 DUF5348 domain-containing protein [[Clostridium] innocuum]MCR0561814.1 DUF5348 domain-containing protein [[Clostridium] innocuum]MCR0604234.1 DUF5348 domain-containing protein [[Clostridium] innocuum]
MPEYKEGIMIYDEIKKRMDIRFSLEEFYGGLHCGEGIDVLIEDAWYPTGIEFGSDWYLSSDALQCSPFTKKSFYGKENLIGLQVRIKRW